MSVSDRHVSYSPDWSTPPEWLSWVSATLGAAWSDPCPEGADFDGLQLPWHGPVYCNHPGSRGSARVWWSKALDEGAADPSRLPFIWCAFSVEQLRHLDPSPFMLPGWMVMPRVRIKYIRQETGKREGSPTHWSVFWCNVPPAQPPEHSLIVRTGQ